MDRAAHGCPRPLTIRNTVLVAAIAATVATAPVGEAQSRGRPPDQWIFALGAALGGTLMEDANGSVVRSAFAPMLSIGTAWRTRSRIAAGVALGGSGGGIDIEDDGGTWSAGSLARIDVMATIGAEVERFTGRLSAGPVWMRGPDDVMPFRGDGGGFAMHWGGDASIEIAVDAARRFRLRIGMDAVRLNPGGATPAPEPGTFSRFHFGVVHAR